MMLAFNDYGIAGISRGACIHICFYWFGFSFWASKLWTVWLLVSVAHPPLTLLQNVPPCLTTRSALISHCANIDSSNIGKSYSGTSSFSQLAKLFYAFMLSTEMSKKQELREHLQEEELHRQPLHCSSNIPMHAHVPSPPLAPQAWFSSQNSFWCIATRFFFFVYTFVCLFGSSSALAKIYSEDLHKQH